MRVLIRALFPVFLATAAAAASVTGTVTSAVTGAPLANMVVLAYDAEGTLRGTASTDSTGLYVLSLEAGGYRFLAYDPTGAYATMFDAGAESFETTPIRAIAASGALIQFRLVRSGFITGAVKDAFGIPIGGAIVEVYNLSGTRRGSTSADSAGNYSVALPPGDYKLVAYELTGRYAVTFHRGARSFAEAMTVRVVGGASVVVSFSLAQAATVSGTAVNAATLAPLPSILIYAYTPAGALVSKTETNSVGAFHLSLPAGDYRFVAADASRVYAAAHYGGSRSFETSAIVGLAPSERRENVQISLSQGALIRGRVNASNFLIAAYNLDGTLHASATSDATGQYALLVGPGEYRIAVSDPSLTHATLFYGGVTDFRFAPAVSASEGMELLGVDVTLPRGGRVDGMVREIGSAEALSGITVAAYDSAGRLATTAATSSDGRYALVIAAGAYRLLAYDAHLRYVTAYAAGATSYETTVPVVVETDAMLAADFFLRRGIRIGGMVTTSRGGRPTGIEVFALDAGGNRVAGSMSHEGAFTMVVTPAAYRFLAVDPLGRYASSEATEEIAIVDGGTLPTIELTLPGLERRRSVRH